MNKLISKIVGVCLGLSLATGVGVGVAAGNQEIKEANAAAPYSFSGDVLDFSQQGLTNGTQYLDSFTNGTYSVQFGGGSNDGKYYTTGTGMRTYGGGYFTISTTGSSLPDITFTWDGTNKPNANVASTGTYSDSTSKWTGSAQSVTFTRPSGSGHWRLQTISFGGSAPTILEVNVAQAITATKALADGATSSDTYKVTGVVVSSEGFSSQYNNISFDIADNANDVETLKVFRWSCTSTEAQDVKIGATAVFTGKLTNFVSNSVHTYELVNPTKVSLTGGSATPEPTPIQKTLAEFISLNSSVSRKQAYLVSASFSNNSMYLPSILKCEINTLLLVKWKIKNFPMRVISKNFSF